MEKDALPLNTWILRFAQDDESEGLIPFVSIRVHSWLSCLQSTGAASEQMAMMASAWR